MKRSKQEGDTGKKKERRPLTPSRVVAICFFWLLVLIVVASVAFVVVDTFVLSYSLSFFVMNSLIGNGLGQLLLQVATTLYLPIFSGTDTWGSVIAIALPLVLILVNIFVIRRRMKHRDLLRNVCRTATYICLCLCMVTMSLSMVYPNYAERVAKHFILEGDALDITSFKDLQTTVESSKYIAQRVIDIVLMELQEDSAALEALDDLAYIEAGELVAICFQVKGSVKSREEHYMRNYFYRAPKTLEDMVNEINAGSPFAWILLEQKDTVYHMQGKDGEYNVKFVAESGYDEAIYNKDGILLTEKNDPVNMGTFNYASPISAPAMHAVLDILPYYSYGNCMASQESSTENYAYQKNADAQEHWRELKARLKK